MKRLALIALVGCACAGCVQLRQENVVVVKQTTLGLDISTDPATSMPHIRLGLVRVLYQRVPVFTNQVHVPAFDSNVDGEVGLTKQTVHEIYRVGMTNAP